MNCYDMIYEAICLLVLFLPLCFQLRLFTRRFSSLLAIVLPWLYERKIFLFLARRYFMDRKVPKGLPAVERLGMYIVYNQYMYFLSAPSSITKRKYPAVL